MALTPQVKLVAKECSRVIEGARDVGTVVKALHLLHQSFLLPLIGPLNGKKLAEQLSTTREADHADLQQLRLHCEILLADAAVQVDPTSASRCFFWDCFNPLSDVLLSIVAADWLPSFSPTERAVLFDSFFCLAPSPVALAGLVGHLSQVQPASGGINSSSKTQHASAFVTAIASSTATELLAARFAAAEGAEKLSNTAGAAAGKAAAPAPAPAPAGAIETSEASAAGADATAAAAAGDTTDARAANANAAAAVGTRDASAAGAYGAVELAVLLAATRSSKAGRVGFAGAGRCEETAAAAAGSDSGAAVGVGSGAAAANGETGGLASMAEVLDLMLHNCAARSCAPATAPAPAAVSSNSNNQSSSGSAHVLPSKPAGGSDAGSSDCGPTEMHQPRTAAATNTATVPRNAAATNTATVPSAAATVAPWAPAMLLLPQPLHPGSHISQHSIASQHHHPCLNPEHLAGLLVSLPDRLPPLHKDSGSSSSDPTHASRLSHEALYHHLLAQLFLVARAPHTAMQLLAGDLVEARASQAQAWRALSSQQIGTHEDGFSRHTHVENSLGKDENPEGKSYHPAKSFHKEACEDGSAAASAEGRGSSHPAAKTVPEEACQDGLAAVSAAACQLACCMLERLARRGFASLAADVLLRQAARALHERRARPASAEASVWGRVLCTVMQALVDLGPEAPLIAEKLVEAVLVQASRMSETYAGAQPYEEPEEEQARLAGAAAAQKLREVQAEQCDCLQTEQQQKQQQQQQQQQDHLLLESKQKSGLERDGIDPVALLGLLLPPLLVDSPSVKYLLAEKFALGQQRRAMLPTSALRLLLDFLGATRGLQRQQQQQQQPQQQRVSPQQPRQPYANAEVAAADFTSNGIAGGMEYGPDSWQWWSAQLRSCFHTEQANANNFCSQSSSSSSSSGKGALDSRAVPDIPNTQDICSPGSSAAYVGLLVALSQAWGDLHDPSMASKTSSSTTNPTPGHPSSGSGKQRGPAAPGVPQQAYLSCMLVWVLRRLRRQEVERCPGVLASLLQGVSARLASPLHATHLQAMRVGKALSILLSEGLMDSQATTAPPGGLDDAGDLEGSRPAGALPGPLFGDQGYLGLIVEELWPGALPRPTPAAIPHSMQQQQQQQRRRRLTSQAGSTPSSSPQRPSSTAQVVADSVEGEGVGEAGDSDDDSDYEAYDVREDPQDDAWHATAPQALQLRALAKALTKGDDVNGVLKALQHVELLVRAGPDELPVVAAELSRALLFCRVPEWAEVDAQSVDERPEFQRARCLAALAAVTPGPSGDALLAELYSPNLDIAQRLLILDCLTAAAKELAEPASAAPRIGESRPGGAPKLLPPEPPKPKPTFARGFLNSSSSKAKDTAAVPQKASMKSTAEIAPTGPAIASNNSGAKEKSAPAPSTSHASVQGSGHGGMRASRTRVWGHVALQKRGAPPAKVFQNRAHAVVLRWATALLREVDVKRHGVDLFGRDALVLGRVVSTLGTFAECAAGSDSAVPLVSAIMELLMAPQVHQHAEAYVRRAVLLAAGQALCAIPAPRLAAAMLAGAGSRDPMDAALVRQLEWLHGWLEEVQRGDADSSCEMMAGACRDLQAALAAEATIALGNTEHGVLQAAGGAGSLVLDNGGLGLARQPVTLHGLTPPSVPGSGTSLITELS